MIASIAGFFALSALATAHGDHGQSQLAGPHQGLWYNTLPGDGGTQVNDPFELNSRETISLNEQGRLRILRDLNFRPPALLPMSGQRRREIRHRIPRSVNTGRSTARSYKSPIHTSTKQVPPSIPEPPTDPAPGSDPAVSDKVLAASICSTYQPQQSRDAFTWHDGSSQRLAFSGGYNVPLQANPFTSDMRILDCGDVPVTSYVYLATGDQKTRD